MMHDQRGFTMMEVMVGTALALLITAGLAAATMGSIQTTATSKQITSASALVHDKIEQLRSLDPSTNPADLVAGNHSEANGAIDQLGRPGGAFTRTWSVTNDTPIPGVSQVVVSVMWSGPEKRIATGTTYVCETLACA